MNPEQRPARVAALKNERAPEPTVGAKRDGRRGQGPARRPAQPKQKENEGARDRVARGLVRRAGRRRLRHRRRRAPTLVLRIEELERENAAARKAEAEALAKVHELSQRAEGDASFLRCTARKITKSAQATVASLQSELEAARQAGAAPLNRELSRLQTALDAAETSRRRSWPKLLNNGAVQKRRSDTRNGITRGGPPRHHARARSGGESHGAAPGRGRDPRVVGRGVQGQAQAKRREAHRPVRDQVQKAASELIARADEKEKEAGSQGRNVASRRRRGYKQTKTLEARIKALEEAAPKLSKPPSTPRRPRSASTSSAS